MRRAVFKRVVMDMVARGEGRILFTSSIATVLPAPLGAVYGGSKASHDS